jgi:hypothetical protein
MQYFRDVLCIIHIVAATPQARMAGSRPTRTCRRHTAFPRRWGSPLSSPILEQQCRAGTPIHRLHCTGLRNHRCIDTAVRAEPAALAVPTPCSSVTITHTCWAQLLRSVQGAGCASWTQRCAVAVRPQAGAGADADWAASNNLIGVARVLRVHDDSAGH